MNIAALRQRVSEAQQQTGLRSALRSWLEQRIPALHPAISSQDQALDTFQGFVEAYICQVPDILEAAQSVADATGLRPALIPVLKVAEAFFLQPPQLPEEHQGLLALLDEAYLAHRLVEEVNDLYVAEGGEPLIPMNTTRANLIVHQLLGEPFANHLDAAVDEAVSGLLPSRLELKDADPERRQALWEEWPCMSQQLGLDIRLPSMA
ncbi:hypothetical protein CK507_14010 [Pseudomonas sp. WN033]|nr:hypothetical protein CK507_14010 [Pseudomonas sp. WN033]